MFTKITLLATAAAILLGSASATFAAPKVVEPIYFTLATGVQGS
jgi:hypothetical protein